MDAAGAVETISEQDEKMYIGFTSHIQRRVEQHNNGLVMSTKGRRPLHLIYFEGHTLKADALKRERYFKTTSGRRTIRIMLKSSLDRWRTN